MLKYVSFDIVFREIPDEITLAINLSGCPNRCEGCHSPWLWEEAGEVLDEQSIGGLVERYGSSITCICFMGGDAAPEEVLAWAQFIRCRYSCLKIGWYSGRDNLPHDFVPTLFDYIKLGRYNKLLGGLDSLQTNQRFYRIENGAMIDCTKPFQR